MNELKMDNDFMSLSCIFWDILLTVLIWATTTPKFSSVSGKLTEFEPFFVLANVSC